MGYYINTPTGSPRGKDDYLISLGAEEIPATLAKQYVRDEKGHIGVVCVLDNIIFQSAGFLFNENEFECAMEAQREKTFFSLPWAVAVKESGYDG